MIQWKEPHLGGTRLASQWRVESCQWRVYPQRERRIGGLLLEQLTEPVFRVKCADFLHFESHIASEGRRTSRNTIQVAVFRPLFGQTSRSATGGRSRVKDNWGILVRPCLQSRRDHGELPGATIAPSITLDH